MSTDIEATFLMSVRLVDRVCSLESTRQSWVSEVFVLFEPASLVRPVVIESDDAAAPSMGFAQVCFPYFGNDCVSILGISLQQVHELPTSQRNL